MKFSAQEEYGLRCILRITRYGAEKGLTISEISEAEGISVPHVGKLLRILRMAGLLDSVRGKEGGYRLAKPPQAINVKEVLDALGGRLYDTSFCDTHTGILNICTHTIDCSIRSIWKNLQGVVDDVLVKITLKDLVGNEEDLRLHMNGFNPNIELMLN